MQMRFFVECGVVLFFLTGCGDNHVKPCPEGLPPPSHECLAGCGNELNVGMPCSKLGGECDTADFRMAFICSIDVRDTELDFCTRPCKKDSECGANAVCHGDPENPLQAGCVPIACL